MWLVMIILCRSIIKKSKQSKKKHKAYNLRRKKHQEMYNIGAKACADRGKESFNGKWDKVRRAPRKDPTQIICNTREEKARGILST